ncbi:MAG: sigma-70 family RNA polymerase sigma factor [Elusimicrobia bacterium]|nr:sigma-70 family RNA polymerase sigma factor [Elusimicrobiota bacterium]
MESSEAFSELIRRCADKAFNFALRLSGNEQDAHDLVQEAFSRAFEHQDSYDPRRPFDAWLHRILRNIYLDEVRRYGHTHSVSLDAPAPSEDTSWDEILPGKDPEPIEGLTKEEMERMVQEALLSLPIHYRTAITLCDIEGVPYDKMGEIMDVPIGTVRSRIHQGRVLMRKAFEELMDGRKKG